ncbi:MAG: BamA/TamA family outer membrane protein [Myxococcota bacterium]
MALVWLSVLWTLIPSPMVAQETPSAAVQGEEEIDPFEVKLIPGVFYTPETSLAFAAAFISVWRDAFDPEVPVDSAQIAAVYTLRQQLILFSRGQFFLGSDDRWRLEPQVVTSIFPNRYYEEGDRSALEDYEDFNSRNILGRSDLLYNIWGSLWFGPTVEVRWFDLTETEEGGLLAGDTVTGSEDNLQLPIGATLLWDSRDHLQSPRSGSLTTLVGELSRTAWGSSYDFYRVGLDVRTYHTVVLDHVLALRGQVYHTGGDVPFNAMPFLGGTGGGPRGGMRGIFATRFIARNTWFGVAEYRAPIYWRFGAVAFVSAGQARSELSDFGPDRIRVAGGGGVRFALIPRDRINLRLDYGVGPGETQFYFNIREAF